MIEKMKNIKIYLVFNILAVIIFVGSIGIYSLFEETKDDVIDINKNIYINFIDDISENIKEKIIETVRTKGDRKLCNIYETLSSNPEMIEKIEDSLQLLVTNRYKYIYVVDKESPDAEEFRFLLDGATKSEEKSDIGELFLPIDIEKWEEAYKNKKAITFQDSAAKGIWMTYLKPIVIDDKVVAMIVIDFSLQGHDLIVVSLAKLDETLESAIVFAFFIFIIMIWFGYIDHKRLKEILSFNEKLEKTVKEEVEKNRQKDQQIIQQSRLAQMGEMISMIAHQWRQPLAAISSTSAGLKLKAQLNKLDNKTTIELTSRISDYSQHLSSTIDDFREFFKTNKEKKETQYTSVIKSVMDIVKISIANKGIELVEELESEVRFNTYPNELKQVVLNLIKNAEDILLDKKIEGAKIIIKTVGNKLIVSDNGGGIPEDIIDKIFDPYFSTKTKKDGTGLGLYMSKTIIEDHCGGKLTVSNNEDGAVFQIELKEIDNV